MNRILFSLGLALSFMMVNLGGDAFAANVPPGFDAAKWQQLIAKVIKNGTAQDTPDGTLMELSNIVPNDLTKPHHADYISALGGRDSSGNFGVAEMYDVSENWRIQNGNWNIDQWIWTISSEGDLLAISHSTLVETMDGLVLSDDSVATGAVTDAAELAHWGQVLNQWYALP